MRKGNIYLYYGNGKGKTTLAIGQGVRAVGEGLNVVMIQFFDFNNNKDHVSLKRLEPNFRAFKFEKQRDSVDGTSREEIQDELQLALKFSGKILETGECEMLILDGICDAIVAGFIDEKDVVDMIKGINDDMDIIISGNNKCEAIVAIADFVYSINKEKYSEKE